MRRLYADQLARLDFDERDLAEGVQRVIHTHEAKSIPAFAVVLKRIREARADRLKAEHADEDALQLHDGSRRFGDADADHLRNWRFLADRGVHWCGNLQSWGPLCPCGPLCHDRSTPSMAAVKAKRDECAGMRKIVREPAPRGWSNAGAVALGAVK